MNKRIYSAALFILMIATVYVNSASAQGKNILYLRFEQKHYHASDLPADDILSVTYYLESPKPSRFHGFQVNMVFQTSKITFTPSGDSRVIFDGSVAGSDGLHQASYDALSGQLFVQALSSGGGYDTSNHLLFQYRVLVGSGLTDSAFILVSKVDAGKSDDPNVDSHIDTVIVEGTSGSPELGWGPIAVAILDSTPVTRPKRFLLAMNSDSMSVKSDSSISVPIFLRGADSANVKIGSFGVAIDTSVFVLTGVTRGSLLDSTASFADSSHGNDVQVSFASPVRLRNQGSLLEIHLSARHRTDTACGALSAPVLQITNSDKQDSTITYSLGKLCAFGEPLIDTSGVPTSITSTPWRVVSSEGAIILRRQSGNAYQIFSMEMFGIDGSKLFECSTSDERVELPRGLSNGTYVVVIREASESGIQILRFSVVH